MARAQWMGSPHRRRPGRLPRGTPPLLSTRPVKPSTAHTRMQQAPRAVLAWLPTIGRDDLRNAAGPVTLPVRSGGSGPH
jgi:hypothetical protein